MLGDRVATDSLLDQPEFHRLDGLYRFLGGFREAEAGKDAGPLPDTLIVEARPDSTTAGVFSTVATCAFAGFPHVYLHAFDGTWVDGEIVVPDRDGGIRNARTADTVVRANVGQRGIDLAWASTHTCADLPPDGHVAPGEIGTWMDRVCPSSGSCFDRADVAFEPDAAVLDAVHVLAKLQTRAAKPLYYLAMVGHREAPPQRSCH